jgi:hypothetical protein
VFALSALAADGLDRHSDKLIEAANKGGDPSVELAKTYIAFAKKPTQRCFN